jgi:hypothetical protein
VVVDGAGVMVVGFLAVLERAFGYDPHGFVAKE